jgi:hypothetical protein
LATKFEVPERIFNVTHRQSAELAFVSMVALLFELVELRSTDLMPTCLKGGVTSEPLLLQVIESLRLHFASQIVALETGCDEIVVYSWPTISAGFDMVFCQQISGLGDPLLILASNHTMSAVATPMILGFGETFYICHRLILFKGLSF